MDRIIKLTNKKLANYIENLKKFGVLPENWFWHQDKIRELEKIDEELINDLMKFHESHQAAPGFFENIADPLLQLHENLDIMSMSGPPSGEVQKKEAYVVNRLLMQIRQMLQGTRDEKLKQLIKSALPNLDEATKKEINELTEDEIKASGDVGHAYEKMIWYGVQAVAITHLMQMAQHISEDRISKEEFIQKYGLRFDYGRNFLNKEYGKFVVSLKKIESDGIFIPKQANHDMEIQFFDLDYVNRALFGHLWVDREYARQLIDRIWQPSDLENTELIQQGIKFGRDLWRTCVEKFMETESENEGKEQSPQSQKVAYLGKKLIAYYSALIFEPASSK